jgi:hypothetical protein
MTPSSTYNPVDGARCVAPSHAADLDVLIPHIRVALTGAAAANGQAAAIARLRQQGKLSDGPYTGHSRASLDQATF